ncbi:hypothetical protein NHX12_009574 [Muraenolepis orangiensis]|uniref:SET domain-containing protein n=1 Tax=Muraenolepis orangiensis TaxID=630683 RepID=A0A9Q0DHG4_9TELE|nr:hypothetical protein NHX12_009574 [Muraenolepis orangiensis]
MDLPHLLWQEYVAQKWSGLSPELKERFTSLQDVDDVFRFAAERTTNKDVDFLRGVAKGRPVQKDTERAALRRDHGNDSFKTRDYVAATLHYSQGVCSSPQSSEQLSLCYANRSASLYRLQRYQESLGDIDSALNHGYPPHLQHKLEERRKQCLSQLSLGRRENTNASTSEQGVADLIPSILPQTTLCFHREKGRHLGCSYSRYCSDACRHLAWEEHHHWECPIGADLAVTGVMSQLALRVALKAGRESVLKAREPIGDEEFSRPSCSDNASEDALPATEEGRLSMLHVGDSYTSDSYVSVYHLLHHLGRQSPGLRFLCAVTIATLYLRLRRAGPPPASWEHVGSTPTDPGPGVEGEYPGWGPEHWLLGSVVLRHMLQLRCNAQAVSVLQDAGLSDSRVQGTREIRVASALFPTLSLLNHSCRPNTSLVFSPPDPAGGGGSVADGTPRSVSLSVRAAGDITAGQEILHCYGPHSSRMPTAERQRLLLDQYYFRCLCEACVCAQQRKPSPPQNPEHHGLRCDQCRSPLQRCPDGRTGFVCGQTSCGRWVCSSEVSLRLQEVRECLETAVELMERDRPDEALLLLERTDSHSGATLSESHPLQGELADALARAHATLGDWRSAAVQLRRSTLAVSAQYGEQSVELGRQLSKLAQLHFNGGDPAEALAVIPRAKRLLNLHCGPQCPEIHQLQAMEDCLAG